MLGLKVGDVRIVTKGDHLGMPFVIRELYVGEGGVPKAKMVSFFEGGPSGSVGRLAVLESPSCVLVLVPAAQRPAPRSATVSLRNEDLAPLRAHEHEHATRAWRWQ